MTEYSATLAWPSRKVSGLQGEARDWRHLEAEHNPLHQRMWPGLTVAEAMLVEAVRMASLHSPLTPQETYLILLDRVIRIHEEGSAPTAE